MSPRKLVQRLRCHQLDLCEMVLKEIKVIYFGAEILYRLFTGAREIINFRRRALESITPSGADEGGIVMPEGKEDHNGETVRSPSPVIWALDTASSYGRGTGARYMFSHMRQLDAVRAVYPAPI